MSILCSICQDFLTERPQAIPANDDLHITALRCGHLFHFVCVQQWFRSTAERARQDGNIQAHSVNEGSCPCCKKAVSLTHALRVFPTGDEDSNAIVEQKRSLDAALNENERLTTNLEERNQLLRRVSADLEEEIVAHDMLKMEYGVALSKIQTLQEQLNDNMAMKGALENSLKTEMEKLEKEKTDALRTIMEMELHEKNLIKEMDSLRVNDNGNSQPQKLLPRELLQNRTKSVIIKTPASDDTSDGESPSASPASTQKTELFTQRNVPYSDVDDSTQSDCD